LRPTNNKMNLTKLTLLAAVQTAEAFLDYGLGGVEGYTGYGGGMTYQPSVGGSYTVLETAAQDAASPSNRRPVPDSYVSEHGNAYMLDINFCARTQGVATTKYPGMVNNCEALLSGGKPLAACRNFADAFLTNIESCHKKHVDALKRESPKTPHMGYVLAALELRSVAIDHVRYLIGTHDTPGSALNVANGVTQMLVAWKITLPVLGVGLVPGFYSAISDPAQYELA